MSQMCNVQRKGISMVVIVLTIQLALVAVGCSPLWTIPLTGRHRREGLDPWFNKVIEESRSRVPAIMKKGKVPGCAIVLVDDQGIIWTEGFRHTDHNRRIPVTPDTPFLICSASKAFNRVCLQLFALAYNLGNFLRRLALPKSVKKWSPRTMREKLIKIGAKVVRHSRHVVFKMAEVAVPSALLREVLDRVGWLRASPEFARTG
ncbi:MAG: transposase [Phycisphaerales bacterium]|nr:MAG: transposase [Phycisphaerales bacterium]